MVIVSGALLTAAALWMAAVFVGGVRRGELRALEAPAVAASVLALLFVLAAVDETSFRAAMQEDHPAEWATFTAAALAAALFVGHAWRASGWARALWGAWAAFSGFVAGEEISWGQRLFGFATPDALLRQNTQLEANLHNALTDVELGPIPLDSAFLLVVVCLVLALAPLVLAGARAVPLQVLAAALPRGPLQPVFLAIGALELWHPFAFGSEACELAFALSVLALAAGEADRGGRWLRPVVGLWAALAAGALLSPLLASRGEADPQTIEEAREELVLLAGDLRRHSEALMNRILTLEVGTYHARVGWTMKELHASLGEDSRFLEGQSAAHEGGRQDRRGFFLDPWGTPYWLFLDFNEQRMVVYSFGPNRRRDTPIAPSAEATPEADEPGDRGAEFQADDLGVTLRWPRSAVQFLAPVLPPALAPAPPEEPSEAPGLTPSEEVEENQP